MKQRVDPSDDPADERAWLTKAIGQAIRQATGTIRSLTATPGSVEP